MNYKNLINKNLIFMPSEIAQQIINFKYNLLVIILTYKAIKTLGPFEPGGLNFKNRPGPASGPAGSDCISLHILVYPY